MATTPLSGTNVRLLSGVNFSNDYKHTRWFNTLSEQTTNFLSKNVVHQMSESNFQRIEGQMFIKVDKDIDSLWGVNYLMFQNTQYGNKWFYAFVTSIEYKQRNTTYVHFEIDVFQTWKFDMNFKDSFVIREHCKLWNSDGSPVVNTIDEGLDYGKEYDNVDVRHFKINGDYKWMVIISKTNLHNQDSNQIEPSIIGMPQPLTYYLVPFRDDGDTPTVILPGGGGETPITEPNTVLSELYSDERAVNNIVSIYVTESVGIDFNVEKSPGYPDVLTINDDISLTTVTLQTDDLSFATFLNVDNIATFSGQEFLVDENVYDGFESVNESKLLMFPYCVTTIDDFKGNRFDIKNEYLYNNELSLYLMGSLGTSNKISYSVKNYNNYGDIGDFTFTDRKISLENGFIDMNVNDVPILTDYLSSFLQGNKNSLLNQKSSIKFNGLMDMVSNGAGAVKSAKNGGVSGGISGGLGIARGAGNTVLQLQGIQAKLNDIENKPPQMAKMGSNTSFDYGNNYNGVYILKKQIKPEYRRKLESFFKMYGYKVNEVKQPNFHTRKKWNYVQTSGCIITGNFNNEDLQEIKNVFDSGITFWHTDDIGNYALENGVI